MKKILIMILCLAMIFALVGCTTFDNFKRAFLSDEENESSTPIVFGVYEPLSGMYKAQGKLEVMGIELAHELYPEVLGKEIKLVYADNRSNLYDAKSALENLMSQKPAVVLGSYGEALTLIAGDYLTMYDTTGITITAKTPILTENNRYLFLTTYTDDTQAITLANFILDEQKIYNVATVSIEGDDTIKATLQRFMDEVKPVVKKNSGKYNEYTVEITDTSYEETIVKLQESRTKAVYLALPEVKAQEFMRECQAMGYNDIVFVGTRNWATSSMKDFVENNKELRIAYCNDEINISTGVTSGIFVKAYKNKYGEDAVPDNATAMAFDAYLLALKAIQDANDVVENTSAEDYAENGATDAEKRALYEMMKSAKKDGIPNGMMIRDALLKVKDFEGASGMITYDGQQTATKNASMIYDNNPAIEKEPVYAFTEDGKRYNIMQMYNHEGEKYTASDLYDGAGNIAIPERVYTKQGVEFIVYEPTYVFSDTGKKYILETLYDSRGRILSRKNRTDEFGNVSIPESALDEYNKQVFIYEGTAVMTGSGYKFYIEDYYDENGERILPQSLIDEFGNKNIPTLVYDSEGTTITVFTIRGGA